MKKLLFIIMTVVLSGCSDDQIVEDCELVDGIQMCVEVQL